MIIYKITNLINNKSYIGQTKRDLNIRIKEHFYNSHSNLTGIDAAIKKYGKENFSIEIIEDNIETFEELNEKEIYYISYYHSSVDEQGYNIQRGGQGKPSIINKMNNKGVYKLDFNGRILNYYESIQEAARENNCNAANLSKIVNKKTIKNDSGTYYRMIEGGYTWCLKEDLKDRVGKVVKPSSKTAAIIYVYDLNDNLLGTFNGIIEASKFTSVDRHYISKCCNGLLKKSGGYKFKREYSCNLEIPE